ncbi:MAG: LpxD N-terminal domain-containing protein, partial [Phormidesmis sp.]
MKFSQIVAALGDEVKASSLEMESELDCDLEGIAAIQEAIASSLSYVEGPKFAEHIATTGAGALVLPFDEALQAKAIARAIPWVSVKNPRLAFARAIALFYQPF